MQFRDTDWDWVPHEARRFFDATFVRVPSGEIGTPALHKLPENLRSVLEFCTFSTVSLHFRLKRIQQTERPFPLPTFPNRRREETYADVRLCV